MERFVQCLSPVHIATGKTLEPFDYIFEDGRYVRVNMDAVLHRLSDEQVERLSGWASERADRIAATRDNRQQSELRREMDLLSFAGGDRSLRTALFGDETLAYYRGRGSFERNLEVREQVKGAGSEPLIPGSSIKGAVRTALAYMALCEMPEGERRQVLEGEPGSDIQGLRRILSSHPHKDQVGQELEKLIFRCGEQKGGRVQYRDIHYDLMRVVAVSDTYEGQAELIVPQVYTFVEKRSRRDPGKEEFQAQAPLITEAHAPGNSFRIRLQIDAGLLPQIDRQRQGGKWVNFRERVGRAFGSEVAGLLETRDEQRLREAIVRRIETASKAFSQAIVEREVAWARQYPEAGPVAAFYERLGNLEKGLVPLRVGWGSHFMSTTLMLALLRDGSWRKGLEDAVRFFGIDIPAGARQGPRPRSDRRIDLDAFPKSRRLVAVSRRPVAPFGWIALAANEGELPGALVDVEEILKQPRREQRPRPGFRRDQPTRRPRPEPDQPLPLRPIRGPAAMDVVVRKPQQSPGKGPRLGDRVSAEVLANDGKRVRVKLDSGEELTFDQYGFRGRPGERVKVKVDRVDAQGRVTKVRA